MDNHTTNIFHILAYGIYAEKQTLLSIIFFSMYLIGVLGNLIIITLVSVDTHLQTPMYLFLGNLSFVDICFITVTLPKLIDILLTGTNSISFIECFTQTYFAIFFSSTEVILLSFMAYDRYVAICRPLQYHSIMNWGKCIFILIGTWTAGCVNSVFLTSFATELPFCQSKNIRQFYCDVKALAKISCASTRFHNILFVETALFGLFPFMLSLTSYIKIISSILHINSTDSKRKAFSTCVSHLTVLIIFYGTLVGVYMGSPSEKAGSLDQVFSVLYAGVTPMLNPLIYSLRNKDVMSALMSALAVKSR